MQQLSLNGKWRMQDVGGNTSVPAQIPGDNYSALLAAGKIEDPYYGKNEIDVQWVSERDWVFSRTMSVGAAMLAESSVYLNCEALDTVTTIRINGKVVGKTENMFCRYRFEVKKYLTVGENEIAITCHAPHATTSKRVKELPYPVPYGLNQSYLDGYHRNVLRKVQCHSGWDWGICLIVAGIYGDVYLGATSTGRIEYAYTEQHHAKNKVDVDVSCEVTALVAGKQELTVSVGEETVTKTVTLQKGLNVVKARVTVKNPKLWWPNDHGEQPLYPLTVSICGDTVQKRIGLRTMEVVTKEDKVGLSFVVRVNGRDIFCKGANWIPADAMPSRYTRENYDELLTSAQQAHMNMIRVWGGGQYENTDFYDLCDEKGLLVWQDFMFACSLYPATPDFLDSVREEAEHQIKRLRDHACLALWCGNNENVGALTWFPQARENRDRYLVDYDRLNEGVLGKAMDECDPTHLFWPSSPCGGRNDYSDCFHDDSRGDMHYWDVWHGSKPFEAYYDVIPRFCSEFGFQSFASMDLIRAFAPESEWNLTSPVMEHHQRNTAGNTKINSTFALYFRIPNGFENFVYLSQVQQALAIGMAVEYWRSLRPTCMGAIYWQLNDNWPVASWASLNHGGKWKLLHYAAKRFFNPVLLTIFRKPGGKVEFWGVNDTQEKLSGTLTYKVLDMNGKVLKTKSQKVALGKNTSKQFLAIEESQLTDAPDKTFVVATFKAGKVVSTNDFFFVEYKKYDLPVAKVKATVTETKDGYSVSVTSDKPAFFVSLNMDGIAGEFDDNCITLLAGETRTLVFTPKQATTLAKLKAALSVNHLRATY